MAPGRIAGTVEPTAWIGEAPSARIVGVVMTAPPMPNIPASTPEQKPMTRTIAAVQVSRSGTRRHVQTRSTRWRRTTIDFDVGVLLVSAVESRGTSTLASGKYAAAHPRAVGYATRRNPSARR